jgi:hypothetical protein
MIVQITPSYPPQMGGVGDYSFQLTRALNELGIRSIPYVPPFQLGNSDATSKSDVSCRIQDYITISGVSKVLLHFSGYGYGQNGLCSGLAHAATNWRRSDNKRRLYVIFHEVHVDIAPPWRRSFWVYRGQKSIANCIARAADRCIVTSDRGARQLAQLGHHATTWPVFSNVGEPAESLPLACRRPVAVVFGLLAARQTALRQASANRHVVRWLNASGIQKIISVGPGADTLKRIRDIPVEAMGPLSAGDVSELLANSRVGLVSYARDSITKSGVVAAYTAHGMLVVNTEARGRGLSPQSTFEYFLTPDTLSIDRVHWQQVSDRGRETYLRSSVSETSKMISGLMQ